MGVFFSFFLLLLLLLLNFKTNWSSEGKKNLTWNYWILLWFVFNVTTMLTNVLWLLISKFAFRNTSKINFLKNNIIKNMKNNLILILIPNSNYQYLLMNFRNRIIPGGCLVPVLKPTQHQEVVRKWSYEEKKRRKKKKKKKQTWWRNLWANGNWWDEEKGRRE